MSLKKPVDILHVYPGASGLAGTYLSEIMNALKPDISQAAFAGYYYRAQDAFKIFYPTTDFSGKNFFLRFSLIRYGVRYFELAFGLLITLFYILLFRPRIVNYSFTSDLPVELLFFSLVSHLTKSTLVLTVHDVVPFATLHTGGERSLARRKKAFRQADFLVVHTKKSEEQLTSIFEVSGQKIILCPFPVMDYSGFISDKTSSLLSKKRKFLYVGHIRNEKGVPLLIEAWRALSVGDSELTIAGNIASEGISKEALDPPDTVRLELGYVQDLRVVQLMLEADFLVLPYVKGTNSGFPGAGASLDCICIASNLPMFTESKYVKPPFLFGAGDSLALSQTLAYCLSLSDVELQALKRQQSKEFLENKRLDGNKIYDEFRYLLDVVVEAQS